MRALVPACRHRRGFQFARELTQTYSSASTSKYLAYDVMGRVLISSQQTPASGGTVYQSVRQARQATTTTLRER